MGIKLEKDYVEQGIPYGFITVRNRKWGKYRHGYQPKFFKKAVPKHVVWKVELEKTHRENIIWLRKIENRVQAIVRVGDYRDWRCDLYTYYIKENFATISELELNKKHESYGLEEELSKKKQTLTRNTRGYFIKARNGFIYEVLNPYVISSGWNKLSDRLYFLAI